MWVRLGGNTKRGERREGTEGVERDLWNEEKRMVDTQEGTGRKKMEGGIARDL